ncbi:hypothetical protein IWX76_003382 [Pedobacter sp. CAN_A7]
MENTGISAKGIIDPDSTLQVNEPINGLIRVL